jgi:predicted transcriptional regulator
VVAFREANMSTTTIRIEDDLKARIATASEHAGKSAHAFIVEAISQKVEQIEAEEELHQLAQKRWAKVLQTGKSIAWDDAKEYLVARAAGRPVVRPSARKMREA